MIFDFITTNKEILENPIIKGFFSMEEHAHLLQNSEKEPDYNISLLNERFKNYYTNVKRINYMSKLIRGIAIDYDKKSRKYSNRFILTDSFNNDEPSMEHTDLSLSDNLDSLITNRNLLKAIKSLTPKQINILEMYFIHSKNNLEIAEYYNTTPQNVSQIRKKTIKKLQNSISKGGKE
ncbi:hypothetical protein AN964_23205 [Heyndrickxia shackletonii]|uniref:RNA polymerase sigma-70 region 4 domain-containing protein n=1 Tax=Heyndrickxia shackletonii TaxID=157838 RepID=A0A0Q3WSM1_9BACI|nr:sigma-70 family RNA polymerase sigma factor [Heyndrickxia shackletonii]KQL50562.1 hypothetical protein AN964_23205 [Heyndrickxia shackletonii]NEY98127.1 sigma-70 family RNA polymerase sigma factor [Heyndrickxia shackletonii]